MPTMRVLVILLLALVVGCIPYRPSPLLAGDRPIRACTVPIQVIPVTTFDQPAIPIESAIDYWNRALGVDIFTQDEAETKVLVAWFGEDGRPNTLGQARIPQPGYCWEFAGVFLKLDPDDTFARLYTVLVHELGHILGLAHHPSPEYIMYRTVPRTPPIRRVSPSELYLIRRLLPMEHLDATY